MYYHPSKYTCKKCGHTTEWSPSILVITPVAYDGGKDAPVCPECWNRWLLESFGRMERVPDKP